MCLHRIAVLLQPRTFIFAETLKGFMHTDFFRATRMHKAANSATYHRPIMRTAHHVAGQNGTKHDAYIPSDTAGRRCVAEQRR